MNVFTLSGSPSSNGEPAAWMDTGPARPAGRGFTRFSPDLRSLTARGFTLLEILVVLFIGALAVALVGPRFGAQIETYRRQYTLNEIEDGLGRLPHRVRLTGRSVELPRDLGEADLGDGQPPLALPEGWQLTVTPPLRISSLGICSAARVAVLPPAGESDAPPPVAYEVEEFSCDLKPERGHGV